jgi:hypothetical protein
MLNTRRRVTLVALGLLLLASAATAQWYQGPSGGRGGNPFDFWQESGHATDVSFVGVVQDDTIRCIVIGYRGTPNNPGRTTSFRHGTCDTAAGTVGFSGSRGVSLDADEYLLGVEGRYGDHIDAIRFFTSKRQTEFFGGSGGDRTFGFTAPSGQMIVALFGRAGTNVDSIGVMYAPCRPPKSCK